MIEWPIFAAMGLALWPDGYDDPNASEGDSGHGDGPDMLGPVTSDELSGWVYPMHRWRDYVPQISSGHSSVNPDRPDHHGCDIMYKRRTGGPDTMFANGTSQGSKGWFCPDTQEIYAPRAGYLWSAGLGPTGHYVVISSAKPIAIFMVHMRSLVVPFVQKGEGRIPIKAGQKIGMVGGSPKDPAKLNHLHIEVWRGGGSASHVNPASYLAKASPL